VVKILKETGFKNFEFRQTIFNNLDKINQVEKIKEGYGLRPSVFLKTA